MATGQDSESSRTKELSGTDHQEIEWQFDAGELESVEGWLGQHSSGSSGLLVSPESTVEITDTYHDTDDWRFYRAGYALRVRKKDGEVEVDADPSPDLHGFVDEMQFALDLTPASISKYETGLYASGLNPDGGDELGPTDVDPSMSVGEVAFAVLRRQFAEMRAHEPGTRLGEDPEELHDMRVPTRRMRAAMKVFGDALPERARWLRQELRWVAHALGDVRDLDVQIERIQAWKEGAGEEDSKFLDRIVRTVEKRRAAARQNMLAVLDSDRYEHLEASFAEMLRRGP